MMEKLLEIPLIDRFLDWLADRLYVGYVTVNERKFKGELKSLIPEFALKLEAARERAFADDDMQRYELIGRISDDALDARHSGDPVKFKQAIAKLGEMA